MNNKLVDYSLLTVLTQAFGPSGNEQEIAAVIADHCRLHADSIRTDKLGNLIAHKKGTGKKIMVVAHMDEIGLIATHINPQGFIYFSTVGGFRTPEMIAKRVRFSNGTIGIIQKEKDETVEKKTDRFYIDIGVAGEQQARERVQIGDMAVLCGEFRETNDIVIAKALDNRVGCFIALQALKNIQTTHELFFVFSAQEEVGARGAKTAAYALEADLALVIDTTFSYDTPKIQNRTSLNRGPAIKVMDRSIIVSPLIKNWMAETAAVNNIPFQWEIIVSGGTDSGPIHLTKEGIPTGGLAIPVRYLHSGSEMAGKKDIEGAVDLLSALINNPLKLT